MTTLRPPRLNRVTAAAASVLAAAAIVFAGGPAAADPSPVAPAPTTHAPAAPSPSAPASPGVTVPGPAPAPGSITWSVQASSAQGPDGRKTFSYVDIKPGTVVHDYVGITNFSAMPVTFQVYATDAFNDKDGQLALLPASEKPHDVGAWVSLLKNSITLAPGERANEPVTLTVPSTASPGDHVGGIIAAISVDAKNSSGTTVQVDKRLAVPLYLRVAGALHSGITIESVSSRYHGTFNPFHGGAIDVTYTIHNTGNVRLELNQVVSAKGLFGLTVASAHLKPLSDLLPGSTYQATVHLGNVFPLGPMNVQIRGVPAQVAGVPAAGSAPQPVSFGVSMWATPWLVMLILALLVGGFFLVRWLLKVRRGRREQAVAAAVAKARRDTVEELKKRAAAAKAKVGAGSSGTGSGGDGSAGTGASG